MEPGFVAGWHQIQLRPFRLVAVFVAANCIKDHGLVQKFAFSALPCRVMLLLADRCLCSMVLVRYQNSLTPSAETKSSRFVKGC